MDGLRDAQKPDTKDKSYVTSLNVGDLRDEEVDRYIWCYGEGNMLWCSSAQQVTIVGNHILYMAELPENGFWYFHHKK